MTDVDYFNLPTVKAADGKTVYRQSHLNTAALCGVLFEYVYIQGRRSAPGIAMVRGIATHKGVEANLISKRDTKQPLELEAVAAAADAGYTKALDEVGGASELLVEAGEDRASAIGKGRDAAIRLAKLHAVSVAPTFEPVLIEEPWIAQLPSESFHLSGTLDVYDTDTFVRDTKTRSKTPSANEAETSVQLQTYAMAARYALGKPVAGVAIDALVDIGTPKAVTFKADPPANEDAVIARFRALDRMVQSGSFSPAPMDAWICSKKHCGFYSECAFGARARSRPR